MTEDTAPHRPQARRRVRRSLTSVPLRLLRKAIDDQNYGAFQSVPLAALTDEEREIYAFVARHYGRFGRFPSLVTMEEQRMGLPDADEPLEHYREALVHNFRMRNASELVIRLQEAIRDNDGEALAEALMQRTEDMRDMGSALADVGTLLNSFRESMNPRQSIGTICLTGIPGLDAQIGGLVRGDIGFLYARPGVGKTFLQLSGALRKVLAGETVLFISKEMTSEQIMHRLVTMVFNVDPQIGLTRRVSTMAYQEMLERLRDGLPEGLTSNLMLTDAMDIRTPADVGALIREVRPELCMVDGTYFLKPAEGSKFGTQTERLTQLIREMRSTASDTRTGIWATWQQNRSKVIGAEGMYGTDAATQDAGLAVELRKHRSEVGMRVATITKNRHGPEGEDFGLSYTFKPTRVGEATPIPRRNDRGEGGNTDRVVAAALPSARRPPQTPRPSASAPPHSYDLPE